jgi:L-fuconolactonase
MSLPVPDAILEPDLPIIDPHHHLWVHTGSRYLIEEFQADLAKGHNIQATIYVECGAMYRRGGPQAMRPVGEVEFAAGMAAMSASGQYGPVQVCTGIIGYADLALGDAAEPVLQALLAASGGRLRGIRAFANWDPDPRINTGSRPFAPQGLLRDPAFHAGFARLAAHGLCYDAFLYHPQLHDLCDLADAFPDTTIVVNHCGGLLGIEGYAVPETFGHWRALVTEVARRPNTLMKLGGLAGRRCGFGFAQRPVPPTARELAAVWQPYIETCIELFGPSRCMFESNFPPDRAAGSYPTLWNAFKTITQGFSDAEKRDLYSDVARRTYRLA